MAEPQHTWPVVVLCEVLAVSRSGFMRIYSLVVGVILVAFVLACP